MSRVKNLWTRFGDIEAQMEQMTPNTEAYQRKRDELLTVYNQIQKAEEALTAW